MNHAVKSISFFLFATCMGLILSPVTSAQGAPSCLSAQPNSDFIYPIVKASYVGGSVPGMSKHKWRPIPWGYLGVGESQFRTEGRLALGSCDVTFAFESKEPVTLNSDIQVLPCEASGSVLTPEADKICHAVSKPSTNKKWYVMQIPYKRINVIARARKQTSDRQSNTTAYLTTATAVLTAVEGTTSKTNAKLKYGGITLGAAVLGYYLLVGLPGRGDNYLSISAGPNIEGCDYDAKLPLVGNLDKCALIAFLPGQLAMFRISNYHDYYNISMILSGETGLEFISENAEKGASK